MNLSKRLQAVANLLSSNDVIADVGCDHGYLSIYLIEKKICNHVIAMDVNEGPLLFAKNFLTLGISDCGCSTNSFKFITLSILSSKILIIRFPPMPAITID